MTLRVDRQEPGEVQTRAEGLVALALRCEQASGADRELDAEIAVAAVGYFELPPKWDGGPIGYGYVGADGAEVHPGHGGDQLVKRYTASLDAAMTLVPEFALFMARTVWDGDKTAGIAAVSQYEDRKEGDQLRRYWLREHEGCAATPALALTAACLRARATLIDGEGEV